MANLGRWIGVAVLAVLTWRFATAPLDARGIDSFLHLPNLIFHEAGHFIFSPLGRFMTVLGGSLFQILIPVICAVSFARQAEDAVRTTAHWYAAAVCTWWAGQNIVDVAPYIADARKLQLTLIGGRTGGEVEGHDWEYLLTQLGWLHLDTTLGRAAQVTGTLVMVAALVWAIFVLRRREDALT